MVGLGQFPVTLKSTPFDLIVPAFEPVVPSACIAPPVLLFKKNMKVKLLISLFFGFLTLPVLNCKAQIVQNTVADFKDGHATITYDLIGFKAKELYLVDVYCSHNDFSSPLKLVTGDVGKNIKEGKGKKIEWKAAEEAGAYKEPLTFHVKIALLFQPLEFINPTGGAIRRGHTTIIEWQGGFTDNEKELELYKGSERVASLGKMKNVWQYSWQIPKDIEKGSDYTLKLTGGSESLTSSAFRIKPRIPLLLKLSPLFVAAAIIPFLGGSKTSEKALPNAPLPE
jgi:hypothetical protein